MKKVYNEVFTVCQLILAKLTTQISKGNPQMVPVPIRRRVLSPALLVMAAIAANAQSPTAPAQNFNVFLENAGSFTNNETEGPVAMGGNLNINGSYQVATNYPGNYTVSGAKIGLLVGGRVYYNGGSSFAVNQNTYVKIGNPTGSTVWYKDDNNAYSPMRITPGSNYNGSPRINMSAASNNSALGSVVTATNNPVFQSGLIDFTAAFNQMRTTATCMSGLSDNANLTNSAGTAISHSGFPTGYQVKLNLHSGANVLNLNGSDLNNLSDFIYNNTPSASQYLIINVNAPGTFNWSVCNSSGGFGGVTGCKYIIWNFYNATALNVQGFGAIEGTVFAPYADITKTANASNVEGQVIAKSYTHNGGENHYAVFAPTVCATTPPTIAITSQEVMWIDANKCNDQGPRGAWLSYVVTNPNTTAMTGVTVTFSGFTGANASYFIAPHDLTRTFSSIAPGQSVPVFFYVDYSDVCNHPHGGGDVYAGYTADYAITVSSSAGTATRNGTIETKELLTTSAGGHAVSSVLSTSNVTVGQTFTQTVVYSFGNNTDLFFQPNCEMGFPDGCLRLVKDTVSATSSSVTGILGQYNALAFPSADVPSTGNTITIIYTWQVLCLDYPAVLHPWAAAKSGTKYKYQDGFDATSTVCFAPTISYAGGPFCPTGTASVTRTGATGGTFTSTSGLSINVSTGAINLAASTPGTYTVTYTLVAGCTATTTVTVSSAAAITGTASVCAGGTTTLGHPVAGGTWQSGSTTVATVSASGVVLGLANGTTIITYTTPAGCTANAIVTVNAAPGMISGAEQLCVGVTTSMANSAAGGTWTSGAPGVANVNSAGVVTGIAAGTTNITYSIGICRSTKVITVNALPADIMGTQSVCEGATTTFTTTTSGGAWSSDDMSVALVGSAGIISGVTEGITTITYTKLGCYKTRVVTVNATPAAITGECNVCASSTTTLGNTLTGGSWSSSLAGVASVGSTGIVTAGIAGTANITYCRNGCKTIRTITVNATPAEITGTAQVCTGSVTTLGNTLAGGVWSSGDTAIATVSSTGIVSGLTAGTTVITYAKQSCYKTRVVTVNETPAAITGACNVCASSSITLSNTLSGGSWSTSSAAIATVSSAGIVTGGVAGIANITYCQSGCKAIRTITANATPGEITGTALVCAGSLTTLSNTLTGGAWSSDDTTIATVSSTGVVSGSTAGTTIITYSKLSCYKTRIVTINETPAAIAGACNVCASSTITLSNTISGGTWSSSLTTTATVGSTGIVTGVTAGVVNISYVKNGCKAVRTVTINSLPSEIIGTAAVCAGAATTLVSTPPGGAWFTDDASVATVGATGIVTSVAPGTTIITYALSTGCSKTRVVTVNATPADIAGTASVCTGSVTTLSNTLAGGTWSSSMTIRATVSATGVVTGLQVGVVNITYTKADCKAIRAVTVNSLTGDITGTASVCTGGTTTLGHATAGGSWSSNDASVASIDVAGIVTGVTPGTAVISYTSSAGCFKTRIVTVNAMPSDIMGVASICAGSASTLTNSISGGTWSSGTVAAATVGNTTGVVTGVSAGTSNITYAKNGCKVVRTVTVNSLAGDITGTASICAGTVTTFSHVVSGGSWSSHNTAVATIDPAGIISGVAVGTTIITYSRLGCFKTRIVTVNASAASIEGSASLCQSVTTTLSSSVAGGTWSSSNASVASVGSTNGVVSSSAPGTATVTYKIGSCNATKVISVNALPAAITGIAKACQGASTTLGNATEGGSWGTANVSIATVDAVSGIVSGIAAGTTIISYTSAAGCSMTKVMTISPLPYAGTITGPTAVCTGTTIHLIDTVTGGTWTSGDTTIATTCPCNSGHVTGVAFGTVVMTYSVTNECGTASISHAVTVNKVPTLTTSLITPVLTGSSSASLAFATTNAATHYTLTWNDAAHTAGFNDVVSTSLPSSPMSIAVPSAATPATYTGTLTVTNGSCTSSAQLISLTVNPSINIYTFAGNGIFGFTPNGNASTATSISHPYHIATDCNGNTYYADYDNSVVRKISAEGVVTTVAGTGVVGLTGNGGPATAARLSRPTGVAVDAAGNLYISDYNNMVVRKVNTAGVISNFAGSGANGYSGDGGAATAAKLSYPSGIAVDAAGNVYIADYMNTAIRKVTPSGVISTVAGNGIVGYTGDGGAATAARRANPRGVAVDGAGNIYIPDYANNVIRKVNTSGIISTIAGNTIPGYSGDGGAATAAKIKNPYGIALDADGNIYFTELQNNIVRKVNTSGVISTIAGNNTQGYSGDKGPAVLAQLNQPMGIAVNCDGKILISDYGNFVIRVLGIINRKPFFTTGNETLQACQNTAFVLNTSLAVNDFDTTQTMSWTITSAPAHGTLIAGYTTSSTGSLLTPSGLSYTPATGYTGTDVFTVQVSDGIASATKTVTVNVSAPAVAGAISGTASMCGLTTAALSNAVSGGTWSSSNTSVANVNGTGVVAGTGYGTTTISYTVTNGCGTAYTTKSFTVNPLAIAGNVIGAANVCVGSSLIYYDTVLGGTWSVGNTSIATVTPTALGVCSVSGVSAGLTTVTYTVSNSCGISYAFRDVTVQLMPTVAAITGGGNVCNGSVLALADTTPYGAWYSSNTAVASADIVTGLIVGLTPGNTTVSYSVHNSCGVVTVTKDVTVNSSTFTVGDISGGTSTSGGAVAVCVASTTTLTNATTGGVWSSSNTTRATVGSSTGIVTGVTAGTAMITYTVTNGCGASIATRVVSVNPLAVAGTISGGGSVCVNATRSLTASVSGGTWSSSNVLRSTVSTSGVVTGIGAGASTISYGVTNGCGTAYATTNVPVDPLPTAGTISGSSTVCFSNVTTLESTVAGGSWSSSNTAIASITTSGVVLGNGPGTVTISYTTHNGCGYAYTSRVQTVNPLPYVTSISGLSTVNMGASISLSDTAAGGVWSSSNTSLATVGSTGVVNGITPGTVTISYAVTNSCGTAYATKEVNVLVLSAYIVHSNVSTAGGNDGCALLFVNGGTSPYTYQWSNGVTTVNNTWLVAGTYSVMVTDANGDTTSARVTITQPGTSARISTTGNADSTEVLSITEVLQAQGVVLSAYPNPFQSATTIRFVLPESSNSAALDIYEAATGRKVTTLFNDKVKQGEEYSGYFDAKDLAAGIYFYKLSTENNTFYGKLILAK